jgi:hypothetical protein
MRHLEFRSCVFVVDIMVYVVSRIGHVKEKPRHPKITKLKGTGKGKQSH